MEGDQEIFIHDGESWNELTLVSVRQHVLISDKSPVRKNCFDSNIKYNENARVLLCDIYKWSLLRWMLPDSKCIHLISSRSKMCMPNVRNMIYHEFSHGAAFYMLNEKNVNVMLESVDHTCNNTLACSLNNMFSC